MVFEGWDAAGKGSAIRRLTQAIDARLYQVITVGAPTDEELARIGWEPPLKAITKKKITGITDPRIIAIGLIALMIILYCWLR